ENQRGVSVPLGTYPDSKSSISPITLRLLVPALLCGCIIGKGGSKINRIRELRCQPSGSFCPPEADNTLLHLHPFSQGLSGYNPLPQFDSALPVHLTAQTSYRSSNLVNRLSLGATAPIPNAWLTSSPYLSDSNSSQTINSNLTSIDPSRLLISPLFIDPLVYLFETHNHSVMAGAHNNWLQSSDGSHSSGEVPNINSPLFDCTRLEASTKVTHPDLLFFTEADSKATDVSGTLFSAVTGVHHQFPSRSLQSRYPMGFETAVGQSLRPTAQATTSVSGDQNRGLITQSLLNSSSLHTANPVNTLSCPKTPFRATQPFGQHKSEMFLPNDLIGCIIGRGGNKINEIRQTSQANIKISSGEEGLSERRITITGTLPAVQKAQSMINNSIELHKHLIALNLAMNSVYAAKMDSVELNRSAGFANTPFDSVHTHQSALGNLERKQYYSGRGPPVNNVTRTVNTIEWGNCLTRQTSLMSTPTLHDHRPTEMHSAPAQLQIIPRSGSVGQSDSSCVTASQNSRHDSACSASVTSVPLLSLMGQSITHPLPLTDTMNKRQIFELIQQLPITERHKWLIAFGMNDDNAKE
ncbi:hypothetical protein AHF37_02596, partial [Paragonimus kellicotti]